MGKFKVGDKVRVVDESGGGKVGDIATVTHVRVHDGYDIYYELSGLSGWADGLYERRLELAPKFKVGDKVRFTNKCSKSWWFGPHTESKEGMISDVLSGRGYEYEVRSGGYSGRGFVRDEHIELIAPTFKVGDFLTKSGWPEDGFEVTKIEDEKVFLSDGFPSPYSYPYDIDEDWIIVEKPDANDTTNCIVALIENGQPKPATHPYVHPTRNKAETEAARLARKHKGREFGVYELVVTKQEQAKHEWQRLALDGRTIDAIKKLREIAGMSLRAAKAAVDDCRAA